MSALVLTTAAFIAAIILIILLHELGHFLVARFFAVKVIKFSIGFGKALKTWHCKSGMQVVLAVLPFGGYVKLLDQRHTAVSKADMPFSINAKPLWQRAAVVLAGPLANLLFAVFAYWVVFSIGITYPIATVDSITPNSIAAKAGMQAQERIIEVDNQATDHWPAIIMAIITRLGDKEALIITTNKKSYDLDIRNWRLEDIKPQPLQSLGIIPYRSATWSKQKLQTLQYSLFPALTHGVYESWQFSKFSVIVIYKMLTGVISIKSLAGPLSIFKLAGLAAQKGVASYLVFLSVISISIAIVNLMPIPGLDGSQLVYLLYEKLSKRPLSVAWELLLLRLGIILLALLIIQTLVNDLLRL